MKNYSKPIVQVQSVENINEPVFLYSGRRIWFESDCYDTTSTELQGWESSKPYFVCKVIALHDSSWIDNHYNEAQYCIVTFSQPIPWNDYNITGTIKGFPLEFSPNGKQARARLDYHNNITDEDGLADLSIYLENFGSIPNASSIQAIGVEFYDDGIDPATNQPFRRYYG